MIAAIGRNRELGKDNKLLWNIPDDMVRFKKLTNGNTVIMGRKTYESLPAKFRPLPNRINIVVTRNRAYTSVGCEISNSIEEALRQAQGKPAKEVFIIGGANIYAQGIKYADKLYLTLIDKEFPDADAFFPDYSDFKKIVKEEKKSDGKFIYRFVELEK